MKGLVVQWDEVCSGGEGKVVEYRDNEYVDDIEVFENPSGDKSVLLLIGFVDGCYHKADHAGNKKAESLWRSPRIVATKRGTDDQNGGTAHEKDAGFLGAHVMAEINDGYDRELMGGGIHLPPDVVESLQCVFQDLGGGAFIFGPIRSLANELDMAEEIPEESECSDSDRQVNVNWRSEVRG